MDNSENTVPGQATLPALEEEIGYGSIANLKPQHERICWEFVLRNGDATAAYLSVYPKSRKTSASANAIRLLKSPNIQERISEIKMELQRRYAVSAGSLILYLSQALQLDRRNFLDEHGAPKKAELLDTETAKLLDLDFTLDRFGNQKAVYSIPKRMQAANELARMMGLHKDKVEITGDGNVPEHSLSALIRGFNEKPSDGNPDSDVRGIDITFVDPDDFIDSDNA
jgi:hypothetical protein